MKFNVYLPDETKELLERQYKEYLKIRPMSQKEQRAVREWVKNGHSVYENSAGAWQDGQIPVEFLDVYRDEEYIRSHTKGMSEAERRKFAHLQNDEPAILKTAESETDDKDLPFT